MKAQFKSADRVNASRVIVIGEQELESGIVNVKNMESGEQEQVSFEHLVTHLTS